MNSCWLIRPRPSPDLIQGDYHMIPSIAPFFKGSSRLIRFDGRISVGSSYRERSSIHSSRFIANSLLIQHHCSRCFRHNCWWRINKSRWSKSCTISSSSSPSSRDAIISFSLRILSRVDRLLFSTTATLFHQHSVQHWAHFCPRFLVRRVVVCVRLYWNIREILCGNVNSIRPIQMETQHGDNGVFCVNVSSNSRSSGGGLAVSKTRPFSSTNANESNHFNARCQTNQYHLFFILSLKHIFFFSAKLMRSVTTSFSPEDSFVDS